MSRLHHFRRLDSCWRQLSRYPHLRSRIFGHLEFLPLTELDVVEIVPRYHGIYEAVDLELVRWVNKHHARGNFRHWASFTARAAELCVERGQALIDLSIAKEVVKRVPPATIHA